MNNADPTQTANTSNKTIPPRVVIVGRPNVGKSSLLNRLAGRRISIVDAMPGVTRDRISTLANFQSAQIGLDDREIELVDTGGHGIEDLQGLTADVERQITLAIHDADLVLFVIDAQTGITPLDQKVAQLLRQAGRGSTAPDVPILMVANKVDSQAQEPAAAEAAALGFGTPVTVSATSGYEKQNLVDAILRAAPLKSKHAQSSAPDGLLLAIVGKRNAGKSTLVNALAGQDRVIVSEIEGTTRDAVDVRFEIDGNIFTAIDTAGVRKRKSMKQDIEYYSHHRALRSVRRADICLLLIDATVPISQVDRQLVREIKRHYRPTVIVINKWDLAHDQTDEEAFAQYMDKELKGFSFAPIVFISAQHADGLSELLAMARNLHEQANHRLGTGELNRLLQQILSERLPSSKHGKRLKVFYASQVATDPPTIGLWVNDPDLFDDGYERFFLNRLRDHVPFSEIPIRLVVRSRKQMPKRDADGDIATLPDANTSDD